MESPLPSLIVPQERAAGAPGLAQAMGAKQSDTKDVDLYPGWGDPRIDSILAAVPGGPAFHANQALAKGLAGQHELSSMGGGAGGHSKGKVTLVLFVGGCTFTEIAAVRFLDKKREGTDFLMATTKLINGNSLIEGLVESFGVEGAQGS